MTQQRHFLLLAGIGALLVAHINPTATTAIGYAEEKRREQELKDDQFNKQLSLQFKPPMTPKELRLLGLNDNKSWKPKKSAGSRFIPSTQHN